MNKLVFLEILDGLAGRSDLVRWLYRTIGTIGLGRRLLTNFIGDLDVHVENLSLRGSVKHRRYLKGLQQGTIEPFTTDLFKRVIKPGMVVCDIGSYLGFYALLAGQLVGPTGTVFAFEPDPRNFRYLMENIRTNDLSSVIVPICKAVSDRTGKAYFFVQAYGDQSRSSLFGQLPPGESFRTIEVDTISIDDLVRGIGDNRQIDVMKIDIEGGKHGT
jgi:FkbM family methyltransferase